MNWPHYAEIVTVADVLDFGACYSGVTEWVVANDGQIADVYKRQVVYLVPRRARVEQ